MSGPWLALAWALAVPVDQRLSLKPADRRIEKIEPGVLAVEAEGPLRAELLPSGNEVLIEPSGKGIGRVFLFLRREVRVIEIAIGTASTPPPPRPACESVKDAACYQALRAWFAAGGALEKLVFDLEGLQAEAKAAQAALDEAGLRNVKVGLSGYGVSLRGAKDEQETRRALRAIWPAILGPLRLAN